MTKQRFDNDLEKTTERIQVLQILYAYDLLKCFRYGAVVQLL